MLNGWMDARHAIRSGRSLLIRHPKKDPQGRQQGPLAAAATASLIFDHFHHAVGHVTWRGSGRCARQQLTCCGHK